ncbi:MAG: hypothetical protein GXZ15_01390 [Campylobacter sp.]|nr:hypothetical protein [Campylobacter sp.]
MKNDENSEIEELKKEIANLKNTQKKQEEDLEKLLKIKHENTQSLDSIKENIDLYVKMSKGDYSNLSLEEQKRMRKNRETKFNQNIGFMILFMVAVISMMIVVYTLLEKINFAQPITVCP